MRSGGRPLRQARNRVAQTWRASANLRRRRTYSQALDCYDSQIDAGVSLVETTRGLVVRSR
jgi:hypothetical protein